MAKRGADIELRDTRLALPVVEVDRPRTSTAIAREFQYLKQKMGNDNQIERSRKTSRMSKGLNPDAPKPYQPPKCISFSK